MRKGKFAIILGLLSLMKVSHLVFAEKGEDNFTHLSDSVMTLVVETKDGRTFNASGFLAIKDKIAVTTWQVVKNARRITARFSNGEEFDVTGIVDKDVRKNLAIIKLKIFGRQFLTCNPQEPERNVKLYYWNKNFILQETAVNKIEISQGVKLYYLSSSIEPENRGGPILNARGEVVGVLGLIAAKEGENISIAIPSSYVLALDSTLEVKPWKTINVISSYKSDNASIDGEIVESLVQIYDHDAILAWSCRKVYGMGYRNGVPELVYKNMEELKSQFRKIKSLKAQDPLRYRILQEIKREMIAYLQGTELYINSVVIAQSSPQGWGAKSQDLFNRAVALWKSFPTKSLTTDLNRLKQKSQVFKDTLPMGVQYFMAMVDRPSGYTLGITNFARNPFFLLVVQPNSLAEKMGLRAGDTIISLNGYKFTPEGSIEDFKVKLKSYRGQKVKAIVKRNGKLQEIILRVPENL